MNDRAKSTPCPRPGPNIVFNPLPELSWEPSKAQVSVQKLVDYVSCEAQLSIRWYLEKKRPKKNWAQFLRVLAILATAAAGVIPLLAEMTSQGGVSQIAPGWASVALVVAATAVGLDRFFGFSTAWMRFLSTEMQIRHALHGFLLDWEIHRVKLAGKPADQDTVQAIVVRCKDFISEINEILKDEMDAWVQEFRQNLAEIDKAAKAQAKVMTLGAVNVKVSNGEKCDDGWELSIDDGTPSKRRGKTAAVRGLVPGQHTAHVTGMIGKKDVRAETAFSVAGGRSEEISLTLV